MIWYSRKIEPLSEKTSTPHHEWCNASQITCDCRRKGLIINSFPFSEWAISKCPISTDPLPSKVPTCQGKDNHPQAHVYILELSWGPCTFPPSPKIAFTTQRKELLHGIRGLPLMMSAKFLDFLTPSPPCPHFYATSLTGFPYFVCFSRVWTSNGSPIRKHILEIIVPPAFASWGILLSLQPTFYPTEAESHGATPSQYGFVFGCSSLAAFLFGPIFGTYGERIGPKLLFNLGGLTQGIVGIMFGSLDYIGNTTGLCDHVQICSFSKFEWSCCDEITNCIVNLFLSIHWPIVCAAFDRGGGKCGHELPRGWHPHGVLPWATSPCHRLHRDVRRPWVHGGPTDWIGTVPIRRICHALLRDWESNCHHVSFACILGAQNEGRPGKWWWQGWWQGSAIWWRWCC